MPPTPLTDLSRCAIHTLTNKRWTLRQCIDGYRKAGITGISVWRNALVGIGAAEAGRMLRDAEMRVPALVRGGFFPAVNAGDRQKALDDNRACIDEAREVEAEMVVLVPGAVPGLSLDEARKQVAAGIAEVLPHAEQANVKLAIEPLHPMYAADRSCINRMAEARQICQQLKHPLLGIAVDVYHVWWDPDLQREIELAGQQKTLFGFHVCDWRVETRHMLNDRGLMGDGCIDLRTIRGWVEQTGFPGFIEVEVFSEQYWAMDQDHYLRRIGNAFFRST
ncbi:MAG TPA: sugar phosphate isomerase/epimerase family protein [Tepidisphaeraceae bacterium]|jgi:sugar phosphate isomerase/epimerase|nr:sugar phosphate isomerase/epimerase family protein [Tepidisphaeraceae bacterium]